MSWRTLTAAICTRRGATRHVFGHPEADSPLAIGCDNTYALAAIHRRYWRARLATSGRSIMSANRGDTLGLVGFARLMARIWYLMLAM